MLLLMEGKWKLKKYYNNKRRNETCIVRDESVASLNKNKRSNNTELVLLIKIELLMEVKSGKVKPLILIET